ncbi:sugar phosphate nucleotidyltransferase [Anaerosalibacter massiliensis]|uniref:Sugar phosphate nucleotidyltransferase n=1 Tax=Anaerosalibacter massiliensis TaxID=1347392 RepID=A0A9X2MFK5_9FIRM|nr:sugar phosphate nucleotidyltransferase [Anaerosalibacter massiliensis]
MIKIKAVIMSGGQGSRLRPLTCHIPKPMVPILNKPVMEYTVELLKYHNIKDIAVTLHYLPTMITEYFGNGEDFGVDMDYYIEETPLGTGGSVKNAEDFLDSTFIVVSGDAFTNIDLNKALDFHRNKNSKATLILKKEPIPLEYGVVITDEDGRITRFLEKPSWGEVFSDTINTGIYILEPEVLNYYKKGEKFDFSKDLFPRLLGDDIPIYGYITDEYWCDIGDLNSYIKTHEDLLNKEINMKFKSREIKDGIWIGEGTSIGSGVNLIPPIYIGENSIVEENTTIEPYSVIGDNCHIGKNSSIKRSILWNKVFVSANSQIRKGVICDSVKIKDGVKVYEEAVIGTNSKVSSRATINPNVKIWPHKIIEQGSIVKENLVWGSKVSKNIFGYRDISGDANIDITPEFSSRLGTAFASVVKEDGLFIISSDEHNSSSLIKNCLISGILSTGSKIIDIDKASLPMCRFAVKHFQANGGIQVRVDSLDENKIHIELLNSNGGNISRNLERKIENAFTIEDFKRCSGERVKDIVKIYNFSSIYIEEGRKILKNISKIKRKSPNILISSKSDNVKYLAKEFLESIGCSVEMKDYSYVKDLIKIMSKEVKKEKFDLGIIISEDGENLVLIDSSGKVLREEEFSLLSFLIGFKSKEIEEVVIPYNFPRVIEDMAEKFNGKVHMTKTNISDMMAEIINRDCLYQYILNFDGIWAIGKILDFLIGENISLNNLIEELPKYYYLEKQIPCRWEDKGEVLRKLIEENSESIETFEGARIIDDRGWVLVLPDNEKPIFNLYVEGFSEEYAEELSNFYNEKIQKILEHST